MQGKQCGQRERFSTIDLERFIPQDHLLRKVDRILDLDFLYGLTEALYSPDHGRLSIDPVLFFRMQRVGYVYGIESDRQLCREVHLNLAYRWFCRLPLEQDVPHHSSLTRIRDRLGEARYREIFETMLRQWQEQGPLYGASGGGGCDAGEGECVHGFTGGASRRGPGCAGLETV